MEQLMNEASQTSLLATLKDLHNVTFSQALEAGVSHYGSLAGPTTDQYGPAPALVSHSVPQEKVKGMLTRGTSGPHTAGSSPSADLQSSLESKLLQKLDGRGSVEYAMTLKHWDTELGPRIFALRASTPRTSAKDSGGLVGYATLQASDPVEGSRTKPESNQKCLGRDMHLLTGWPTTRANDSTGDKVPPNRQGGLALKQTVQMVGWMTAKASDGVFALPRTTGRPMHRSTHLTTQSVALLTDADPTLGPEPSTGLAEIANGAEFLHELGAMEKPRLNPAFSLWLMGYPKEWLWCAPLEVTKRS